MKIDPRPDRFEYTIRVAIKFTAQDLRTLKHFADHHYSSECRRFFEPGHPGNSWKHHFRLNGEFVCAFDEEVPPELECDSAFASTDFRTADICTKILEGAQHETDPELITAAIRLRQGFVSILEAIREESARVRRNDLAPTG